MRKISLSVLILALIFTQSAKADSGKEFFMSVVYGTLAGTLVGAATLAFTTNPGDNLNNVARGASYGLYAGILLGLYINYALSEPSEEEKSKTDENGNPPPEGDTSLEDEDAYLLKPEVKYKLTFKPYMLLENKNDLGFVAGAQLFEVKF
ncbi:MAG: hypothetical protein IPM57_02910 [Oligoflexia bacterium]|nr:hypothetical protein [Oligoflexia bacterium]